MAAKRARLQHVDIDAVIDAYANSDTHVRAICEQHRIGWSTLYRLLDEQHIPRRELDHAPKIPGPVEREIVRAFHTGESLLSVASRLGVSRFAYRRNAVSISQVGHSTADETSAVSLLVAGHGTYRVGRLRPARRRHCVATCPHR